MVTTYRCIDCGREAEAWREIPHREGCPTARGELGVLEIRGPRDAETAIVGAIADKAAAGELDAAALYEEAERAAERARLSTLEAGLRSRAGAPRKAG